MNSNISYNIDRFSGICSGRDCTRKPKKLLRIKYIKKVGKFCEACASDLFEVDLVDEELQLENSTVEGQ
ncbi:MAG: hypothetical protein ACRD8W_00915 [Nitrososphaeraceae archaeon]